MRVKGNGVSPPSSALTGTPRRPRVLQARVCLGPATLAHRVGSRQGCAGPVC